MSAAQHTTTVAPSAEQEFHEYMNELETYFREHGATNAEDQSYLQRVREGGPSPCLRHELPEYWFDSWLACRYRDHPSLNPAWHRQRHYNRYSILLNSEVGCFECVRIFPSREIETYVDVDNRGEPTTAQCPYCSNLSVIPSWGSLPITLPILQDMHDFWLKGPYRM